MRFRNLIVISLFGFLACLSVLQARSKAKNNGDWNEPFEHWSRDQAMTLLNDSPWAKSQKIGSILNIRTAGDAGTKDYFYTFTLRFFSALPVRESYVRLYQLLNDYGSMDAVQKQKFDNRYKRGLDLDVSKRVIVALDFSSNDPQATRDVMDYLHNATRDTLWQTTYLISQRLGRVDLAEYYPPSTDGTGAKFIFPREVNGQPVVSPDDKDVRLDLYIPLDIFSRGGLSASPDPDQAGSVSPSVSGTGPATTATSPAGAGDSISPRTALSGGTITRQRVNEHILISFDVKDMMHDGKLAY
jgi:hypothetical protein